MADENAEIKKINLTIVRENPDKIFPIFVNDLVITHSENEFFLTFSLIEAPSAFTLEDLDKATISAITKSKLIMTPKIMESVIDALTKNLKTYKESADKKGDDNG